MHYLSLTTSQLNFLRQRTAVSVAILARPERRPWLFKHHKHLYLWARKRAPASVKETFRSTGFLTYAHEQQFNIFLKKNSKFGCLLFVEIIPSLVVVAALLFCSWRGRKRLAPLPQLIKCLDPSGLQKMHLFFYVMKLEFSFLNFKFPNFWI